MLRSLPGLTLLWFGVALVGPVGSSASVPGLTGTQGNDITLDHLYRVKNFRALPAWPVVYVSADNNAGPDCVPTLGAHTSSPRADGSCLPLGDDANPGTLEAPVRSMKKVEELLELENVIVSLDPFDTWDQYPADWDPDRVIDIQLHCGSQASPAWTDEPCAFLVGSTNPNPARPAVLDCSGWNPASLGHIQLRNAASGYLGVGNLRLDACPRVPLTDRSVFRILDDSSAVFVNVEATTVQGEEAHFIRNNQPGSRVFLLNTAATYIDSALYNSDCAGPGCGGPAGAALCTPGVADAPYPCCDGGMPARCGSESHMYEWTQAYATLVSNRVHEIRSWQGSDSGGGTGNFWLTEIRTNGLEERYAVIGPWFRGPGVAFTPPGGNFRAANVWPSHTIAGTSTLDIARLTVSGITDISTGVGKETGVGVHVLLGSATGSVVNLSVRQSTFTDMREAIVLGPQCGADGPGTCSNDGTDTPDVVNATLQCNLIDELEPRNGGTLAVAVGANNSGIVNVRTDATNVHDDEDQNQPNVFAFDGTSYASASAVPDAIPAALGAPRGVFFADFSGGSSFFGDDASELGPGDQNAWGPLEEVLIATDPEALAVECPEYTIAFPFPMPVSILGTAIESLRLATHHRQVGDDNSPPPGVPVGPLAALAVALGLGAAAGLALTRARRCAPAPRSRFVG